MKRFRKQLVISFRDCVMLFLGGLVVVTGLVVNNTFGDPVPLAPESSKITAAWIPDTVRKWEKDIVAASQKYNIDPNLIAIIMTMESGGYDKAESPVGAQGLMQVMPATGKDIASKFLKEPRTEYDLKDGPTSIEFGTAYLAYLRDEFGTPGQGPDWTRTVELIAAGYNGGPGAANKLEQGKGLESAETVVYARDAFNMWRERVSNKSLTFDRWKERGGTTLLEKASE